MKTTILTVLLALGFASSALAMAPKRPESEKGKAIPAASYIGLDRDRDRVQFLVRPFPGRNESYLGVLVWNYKMGRIYLIDPLLTGSSYAMTPLQVTSDGEIGVIDSNPSLTLTLQPSKPDEYPGFTIANANSGNTQGFQGSLTFDSGRLSSWTWTDLVAGLYKDVAIFSDEQVTVSAIDTNSQASALFTGRSDNLNGQFLVRPKVPGLYSFHEHRVKDTGVEVSEVPSRLALFINNELVLVDGADGSLIGRFDRK